MDQRCSKVSILNGLADKERKLETKNRSLLSALKICFKIDTSNGTQEERMSSINYMLMKKLLEYREVRNYTALESKDDGITKVELLNQVEGFKKQVFELLGVISKKHKISFNDFSAVNIKHHKAFQNLADSYILLLGVLRNIISEKSKVQIKLAAMKGNPCKIYGFSERISETEFKKMLIIKKELEIDYCKMQRRICKTNEKLIQKKDILKTNEYKRNNLSKSSYCGNLFNDIATEKEAIKKVCKEVENLKIKYIISKQDLQKLRKQAGILIYHGLLEDYKKIEDYLQRILGNVIL